jgi:small-conductance mechanosensitive channel
MSSSNLFILALTGLLLFIYELLKRSPDLVPAAVLQFFLVAVLIGGSIATVNILIVLIVDIWFGQIRKRQVSALLKLLVSIVLYFLCLFLIFSAIGLNITALFTTSALLTAIIGLALQPTLGNFFSGISLRIDQPFKIGDRIISADQEGEVVSITWRATTIQTADRLLVHIPNGLLAQDRVKVIPLGGQARRAVDFSVPAAAPPQQVIDIAYEALLNQPHANVNLDRPLLVQLLTIGPGNSSYRILYFPLDYGESSNRTDRELLSRVWYALHRQHFLPDYSPSSETQYLALIQAIAFFQPLSGEAHNHLVSHSYSLLFDAGERLQENNLPSRTLFIVVKGRLNVSQGRLQQEDGQTRFQPFNRSRKQQPLGRFNPDTLDEIADHLVQSLGPAAFRLVQDTAQRVTSVYELYHHLALSIDDPNDRDHFLSHSPIAPTETFQRGNFLGELSLFFNQAIPATLITTAVETELLAVPQAAMAAVFSQDPTIVNELAHRLTEHINNHLLETMWMPAAEPLTWDQVSQRLQQTFRHSLRNYLPTEG